MAFDPTAFANDILKNASIDDGTKQALMTAFSNPVIARNLEDSTLRQSDYSRLQADLQAKIKSNQEYWGRLNSWEQTAKAELERERQALRTGAGVDPADPGTVPQNVVSKEELKTLEGQYLAYNAATTKLAMQHLKDFNEVLDLNEVIKVAQELGTNINLAYEKYVAPKKAEIDRAQREKDLAAAREEGKAEALRNQNFPTQDNTFAPANTQLDNLMKKPDDTGSKYGSMAAIEAWKTARRSGVVNTGSF